MDVDKFLETGNIEYNAQTRQEGEQMSAQQIEPNLVFPLAQGLTFGAGSKIIPGLIAPLEMARQAITGEEVQGIGDIYTDFQNRYTRALSSTREQQPIASTAAEVGGAIAGAIPLAGSAPIRALGNLAGRFGLPGRVAAGAVGGEAAQRVYEAGEAPLGQELETLGREGVSLGGVLGGSLPVLGSVARSVTPVIDDLVKPIVRRASEFNIPLRLDQVAPSKMSATVQKISQAIPGSGTDAFEDLQRKQWTKALAKTLGLDSDNLGPSKIKKFKKQNSQGFDNALKGKSVDVLSDDIVKIESLKSDIDNLLGITDRDARILSKEIDAFVDDIGIGEVSAQKLSNIRSNIIEKASSSKLGSPIYSELVDNIDNIASRHGDIAELSLVRKRHRNFKTIEKLIDESGNVDPSKLLQKVRSNKYINEASIDIGEDDLVDLARIGRFIKTKGGSDTFEKSFLAGGIGTGVGAAVDPTLGVIMGAGVLGNVGLQKALMQNQALMRSMARQTNLPATISANPALKSGIFSGGALGAIQQ